MTLNNTNHKQDFIEYVKHESGVFRFLSDFRHEYGYNLENLTDKQFNGLHAVVLDWLKSDNNPYFEHDQPTYVYNESFDILANVARNFLDNI